MAITLPTPIRVAAGLLGAAKDRLATLPQDLPVLAVAAAGQVFRVTLRVRQEIAELAIRGDDLLAGLTGGEAAERPEWAVFDEDSDDRRPRGTANEEAAETGAAASAARARAAAADRAPDQDAVPDPADAPEAKLARAASEAHRAPRTRRTPGAATSRANPGATGPGTRTRTTGAQTASATTASTRASTRGPAPHRDPVAPATTAAAAAAGEVLDAALGLSAPADPLSLTTAELKAHVDGLAEPQVRELLLAEELGERRAAYLTLLTNRLTTLGHDPS